MEQVDPDNPLGDVDPLFALDVAQVYGDDIRDLSKACNENIVALLAVLRGVMLGIVDKDSIRTRPLDVDSIYKRVKSQVSDYADLDAELHPAEAVETVTKKSKLTKRHEQKTAKMDAFHWLQEYETAGGWMDLEEFLEKHGDHDIVICDEGPTDADDLRQMFGENAAVDYLGEESPHYLENDGLYFIVRPPTKKGTLRKRGGTHIVVYPS